MHFLKTGTDTTDIANHPPPTEQAWIRLCLQEFINLAALIPGSRIHPSRQCILLHPRLIRGPCNDKLAKRHDKLAKRHSTWFFHFSSWPLLHKEDMMVLMVWAMVFIIMVVWAFEICSTCIAIRSPVMFCSPTSFFQHNYISCTVSLLRELTEPKLNFQKTEGQIQKVLISFLA